jgi:hypothetical protein
MSTVLLLEKVKVLAWKEWIPWLVLVVVCSGVYGGTVTTANIEEQAPLWKDDESSRHEVLKLIKF